jgi:hypothetical protein
VPQPFRPLAPKLLQPLATPLLEALFNQAIALGPLALDLGAPLALPAVSLDSLALESLSERLAAASERNYVGICGPEAARRRRPAAHSLIGDAVVPCQNHAERV